MYVEIQLRLTCSVRAGPKHSVYHTHIYFDVAFKHVAGRASEDTEDKFGGQCQAVDHYSDGVGKYILDRHPQPLPVCLFSGQHLRQNWEIEWHENHGTGGKNLNEWARVWRGSGSGQGCVATTRGGGK